MRLNIVIPVYNEGERLLSLLQQLAGYLKPTDKLVVVDASDKQITDTISSHAIFQQQGLFYLRSAKGRASQMNAGADFLLSLSDQPSSKKIQPNMLWFLHSDSGLSADHLNYLHQLESPTVWGRFDIRLVADLQLSSHIKPNSRIKPSSDVFPLGIISTFMNLRSRFTQIMTGDQGIFVRSDVFQQIGGFADIPLMEDIEISKRLRKIAKANCTGPVLHTCARRWQQHGWAKTVLLMWQLRMMYWLGVSPEKLVKKYYG